METVFTNNFGFQIECLALSCSEVLRSCSLLFTPVHSCSICEQFGQFASFIQLLHISAATNKFPIDKYTRHLKNYQINKRLFDYIHINPSMQSYRCRSRQCAQCSLNSATIISMVQFNGRELLLQIVELLQRRATKS